MGRLPGVHVQGRRVPRADEAYAPAARPVARHEHRRDQLVVVALEQPGGAREQGREGVVGEGQRADRRGHRERLAHGRQARAHRVHDDDLDAAVGKHAPVVGVTARRCRLRRKVGHADLGVRHVQRHRPEGCCQLASRSALVGLASARRGQRALRMLRPTLLLHVADAQHRAYVIGGSVNGDRPQAELDGPTVEACLHLHAGERASVGHRGQQTVETVAGQPFEPGA